MSDDKLRALERKFRKEPEKVRLEYACELWRIGEEHTAARLFMKENFLGIPEVEALFGAINEEERAWLHRIPFKLQTLIECAETHVLCADLGWSLERMSHLLQFKVNRACGYARFWLEQIGVDWCLVRKAPVEDSFNKTWKDQIKLLQQGEKVPTARELANALFMYNFHRKDPIMREAQVRTSSANKLLEEDTRADIGFDNRGRVSVYDSPDELAHPQLGLASAVELNR